MELCLQKFMREHDNWEELLTSDPYNLKIARDEGYMLFKYNQITSDFNLPEVQEARGIIFRESDKKCVCHPFNKFGNYGESYCPEIDWSTASVQEKVDGSLMKVWYDDGWHVSTNGNIDAGKAMAGVDSDDKTFLDLFKDALHMSFNSFTIGLTKNYCYLFELVSPITRVVIEYSETKLYFLGVRDMNTHQEYLPDSFNSLRSNFDIPKRYNLHSLAEVKAAANALPWDEEGYVVCDRNFNRVKIKSPEYVMAHHGRLNGRVSYTRLLKIILANETDEFLIYASDYTDKVKMLEEQMKLFKDSIKATIAKLEPEKFTDKMDYVSEVKKFPGYEQKFLFSYQRVDDLFSRLRPDQWKKILIARGVI